MNKRIALKHAGRVVRSLDAQPWRPRLEEAAIRTIARLIRRYQWVDGKQPWTSLCIAIHRWDGRAHAALLLRKKHKTHGYGARQWGRQQFWRCS